MRLVRWTDVNPVFRKTICRQGVLLDHARTLGYTVFGEGRHSAAIVSDYAYQFAYTPESWDGGEIQLTDGEVEPFFVLPAYQRGPGFRTVVVPAYTITEMQKIVMRFPLWKDREFSFFRNFPGSSPLVLPIGSLPIGSYDHGLVGYSCEYALLRIMGLHLFDKSPAPVYVRESYRYAAAKEFFDNLDSREEFLNFLTEASSTLWGISRKMTHIFRQTAQRFNAEEDYGRLVKNATLAKILD